MEIFHHIGFNTKNDPSLWQVVKSLNLNADEFRFESVAVGTGQVVGLDISESHPKWLELSDHLTNVVNIEYTLFSNKEILQANWLRLIPGYQTGYPQPEDTWVTNPPNFAEICPECGIHKQIAPYIIKGKPKVKNYHFMSLFWTYALFCIPTIIKEMQKARLKGYDVWDVILQKSGEKSPTIKQIVPQELLKPGLLKQNNLIAHDCVTCGTKKYPAHRRGLIHFSREAFEGADLDIYETFEWFGWGHSAYREIIISNHFARLILENGWKGVQLKVVDLV